MDHQRGKKSRLGPYISSEYFNSHLTYWMLVNIGYLCMEFMPNSLKQLRYYSWDMILWAGNDSMKTCSLKRWKVYLFCLFVLYIFLFHLFYLFLLCSFKADRHNYCPNDTPLREASWQNIAESLQSFSLKHNLKCLNT